MSAPTSIRSGLLLSISSLASALNASRDTVRRRLVAAGVQPAGERGGHPVYRLRDAVDAWLQGADGDVDPDKLEPFQRRAYYQGELDKTKLQVERGELIPRTEVERDFARSFQLVAQAFDTIPDTLERDAGLRPAILELVEQHLGRVREELYRSLIEDPEELARAAT